MSSLMDRVRRARTDTAQSSGPGGAAEFPPSAQTPTSKRGRVYDLTSTAGRLKLLIDQVLDLLPKQAKTRQLAKMIMPHLLEDLEEIPEEIVNDASRFILVALARVWNPKAGAVIISLGEAPRVMEAMLVTVDPYDPAGVHVRETYIGEHDSAPAPALPGPMEPESDDRDAGAEPPA